MSTLIERHIVSLLAEKDDKAISLLYENYGDTLFGVAYKVVKDEELAQDVLVWFGITLVIVSNARVIL